MAGLHQTSGDSCMKGFSLMMRFKLFFFDIEGCGLGPSMDSSIVSTCGQIPLYN